MTNSSLWKSTKKFNFVAYTNRFLSVWNVQIWSLSEFFFLPRDLVKFRPADYYLFGPMGHSSFLVISQVFKIPTHDLAHLYTVIRCVWHENFVKIHQKLSELLGLQTAFFTLHGLLGILHLVRKPFGRVFLKTRIFKSYLSSMGRPLDNYKVHRLWKFRKDICITRRDTAHKNRPLQPFLNSNGLLGLLRRRS